MSTWVEARLPQARDDIFARYERTVAAHMNAHPNQLIADVGGGRSCPFAKYRDPASGTRIVALDLSEDEIRHNRDVDEARVADVMRALPFGRGEVDMVVSRSVLEHLTDLEAFVDASRQVLKPGGYFIHLFPSRFAPFAVVNRALPPALSRRALYFFQPRVAGICGFPAFYDRCCHSKIREVLERNGFTLVDSTASYYQSRYYNFFIPAYLTSAAYEMAVRAFGIRDLAAYLLIVARRD